jgi:hypothetical protein
MGPCLPEPRAPRPCPRRGDRRIGAPSSFPMARRRAHRVQPVRRHAAPCGRPADLRHRRLHHLRPHCHGRSRRCPDRGNAVAGEDIDELTNAQQAVASRSRLEVDDQQAGNGCRGDVGAWLLGDAIIAWVRASRCTRMISRASNSSACSTSAASGPALCLPGDPEDFVGGQVFGHAA